MNVKYQSIPQSIQRTIQAPKYVRIHFSEQLCIPQKMGFAALRLDETGVHAGVCLWCKDGLSTLLVTFKFILQDLMHYNLGHPAWLVHKELFVIAIFLNPVIRLSLCPRNSWSQQACPPLWQLHWLQEPTKCLSSYLIVACGPNIYFILRIACLCLTLLEIADVMTFQLIKSASQCTFHNSAEG